MSKLINYNYQDIDGKTLLMHTIEKGLLDISRILIEGNWNANLNITDKHGKTALMYTIENNSISIAQLLIIKKCKINMRDNFGNTELMIAMESGKEDIASILIHYKCNVHFKIVNDYSLIYAIKNKLFKVATFLILNNCNIDVQDFDGFTPLMHIIQIYECNSSLNKECFALIKLLVEKKCNMDIYDYHQQTALMHAVKNNQLPLVWKMYEALFMKIINDDNNIFSNCWKYNCGDLNVIKLITQYI
ncbi:MAG: hypothetical protein Edafosvirus2_50 [Edafosvirus sp.]|uniref:Uncharacterized protein n=1 Tax=Edafosvirus sp. TaxID=2487765 RepID=A0A3G4ZV50_9VIRU|nr:MAG: hypothetical protein Edafosvirus2_50 [Edafosvirus sp.]